MDLNKPNIVPYQGCQGYWIKAASFHGSKSFGYYICNYCQKNWMSAHAMKGYRQGCKGCDRKFMPQYLWVNDQAKTEDKKGLKDEGKPHLASLCEACKKGVCSGSGGGYRSLSGNYQLYSTRRRRF